MCTKNNDHMIYSSWNMVCNRWTDRQMNRWMDGWTDVQKKWHIEVGAPPKYIKLARFPQWAKASRKQQVKDQQSYLFIFAVYVMLLLVESLVIVIFYMIFLMLYAVIINYYYFFSVKRKQGASNCFKLLILSSLLLLLPD